MCYCKCSIVVSAVAMYMTQWVSMHCMVRFACVYWQSSQEFCLQAAVHVLWNLLIHPCTDRIYPSADRIFLSRGYSQAYDDIYIIMCLCVIPTDPPNHRWTSLLLAPDWQGQLGSNTSSFCNTSCYC